MPPLPPDILSTAALKSSSLPEEPKPSSAAVAAAARAVTVTVTVKVLADEAAAAEGSQELLRRWEQKPLGRLLASLFFLFFVQPMTAHI